MRREAERRRSEAGPTGTGGRSCKLAATPSSLHFLQMRITHTLNPNVVADHSIARLFRYFSTDHSGLGPENMVP